MKEMRSKFCLSVLFILALNMPLAVYSQCADIYNEGVTLMENGRYKDAINVFKAAKECDSSLAQQCDAKIRECRKKIAPDSKPKSSPSSNASYIMTIDKKELYFGAESTAPQTVKVQSSIEWPYSSSDTWCKVSKNSDKLLSISCDINKSSEKRTAIVTLGNGKDTKKIKVIQEGKEAILNIIPDKLVFDKEEQDYVKIPLECTVTYQIVDQPIWIKVLDEYMEQIVVKVEPFKVRGNYREGYLKIKSADGNEEDYVKIEQYKKLPGANSKNNVGEKKGEKISKRRTFLGNKK